MLTPQLTLAELGYKLFPLQPNSKVPYPGSRGCKDATTDAAQIERFMADRCNWGMSTDGLCVVDVDLLDKKTTPRPNLWPHDENKALELAAAPMVLTPTGGRHYYHKAPAGIVLGNSASTLAPGVDIRANGGYVVVPPSIVDGKPYRWIPGPLEVGPDQLPLPPSWLLTALAEPTRDVRSVPAAGGAMLEGCRNDSLFRHGCAMRRRGMTFDEIVAALSVANAKRCQPPLPDWEVEAIAKSAAEFEPDHRTVAVEEAVAKKDKNKPSRPIIVNLADVQPQKTEWLWPSRIAVGEMTCIAGYQGLGKSFLTLDIASRVTTGRPWPDAQPATTSGSVVMSKGGGVVLLSAEDDLRRTIRPRLDSAGADVGLVTAIEGVELTEEGKERDFNLEYDLPNLERAIQQSPDCKLVIIDPVSAYMGKKDNNSNAEVRSVLAPLRKLAERHRVAVVFVTHINRGESRNALDRVMGSGAFTAAPRTAWLVAKDRNDAERRLFVQLKNNLAADPGGLAYKIANGAVAWEPDRISITADAALGDGEQEGSESAIEEAKAWLLEILPPGHTMDSNDIRDQAAEGISFTTLKRAKKELGIVAKQKRDGSRSWWVWTNPVTTPGVQLATQESTEPRLGFLGLLAP